MKRFVTVNIGKFSLRTLMGEGWSAAERAQAPLVRALKLYLHDSELNRPGWAYPTALPRREGGGVELELAVDGEMWDAFEREAERQGVTVSQLAGHAALYYAAELDAGRTTQRILDRLEQEGPEGQA